jgi:Mn2+/Fe2+ NRAMP family transporter
MTTSPEGCGSSDGVVVRGSFGASAGRRSVLDRAHQGDIRGAWGTVRVIETGRRVPVGRRLAAFAAVAGPGLIVMVNDAGGLSLFAQAGQDHGLRLWWLVVPLALVLFVNQEMVVRLGAVTGAGHARLIFERFGRRWGWFALVDLLALNILTIITEFIGIALACGYFGVPRFVSVPVAAAGLIAVTVRGSFRGWERAMFAAVAGSLLVVPLGAVALSSHARPEAIAPVAVPTASPSAQGVLFVIALAGTTVTPWQLFFQQSNVVDKRITSRWVRYERGDTAVGTGLFVLGASAVLVACSYGLHARGAGRFVDAGEVARGLASALGTWAGVLFSLALLGGSVAGAAAASLATSYAVGDATGLRQSLHRPWRQARTFHGSFVGLIVVAAVVVLLPATPLGLVTVLANVLAGVLLPSASVFLILLSNDRAVLGPWANPPWLNAVAAVAVGTLVVLSALLVLTTLFPAAPVGRLAVPLGLVAAGCALATHPGLRRSLARREPDADVERSEWTMPSVETLAPPLPSRPRTVCLTVMRIYLLFASAVIVMKAVRLLLA